MLKKILILSALLLIILTIICFIFFFKFFFKSIKYELKKIPPAQYQAHLKKSSHHTGAISPDTKKTILIDNELGYCDQLRVLKNNREYLLDKQYNGVENLCWAPNSKRFAFIDHDFYSYGGDISLIIINTNNLLEIKIDLNSYFLLFDVNKDLGQREMIQATDPIWVSDKDLIFSLKADYLGFSGHPGINQERQSRLKENFDKHDPIDLGCFLIKLF